KAGRPENMRLYETYLQGMYYINSRYVLTYQEEDFIKAMKMFAEAMRMDPDYAKTYVGMAWAYWHKYSITDREEDLERCVQYGEKGYHLGPELADAKLAKGFIHFLKGEYDEAFRKYRIALEQNPNSHAICMGIGYSCEVVGLHEKAIPFLQKAVELAPFYIFSRTILALCHQGLGEFEKAGAYLGEALNLNPRNPFCLGRLTEYLIRVGRYDEAEGRIAELERVAPRYVALPKYKALIHAARGEREKALHLYKHPTVFAVLGMNHEALQALRSEMAEGIPEPYLNLIHNPLYKGLRDDPGFERILAQAKALREELLRKYGNSF
ncbi:MAG: tetratricopeptide repeat protein, partial [Candidatus Aminicenantes bacterium]|nr:tetratricopeptide repeat protein [Candidatus Aminicenantes bacterium]